MTRQSVPECLAELRLLVEHLTVLQGEIAPLLAAIEVGETEKVKRKIRELEGLLERQADAYRCRGKARRPRALTRGEGPVLPARGLR
jgi:hypothetical protein